METNAWNWDPVVAGELQVKVLCVNASYALRCCSSNIALSCLNARSGVRRYTE